MIRIFIGEEKVFETDEKGYFKKNLQITLTNHKGGSGVYNDVEIPMWRDFDIHIGMGRRPSTDLELLEEEKRQALMDKEGLASLERERIKEMARFNITDPHDPDYVPIENLSPETIKKIEDVLEEAFKEEQEGSEEAVEEEVIGEVESDEYSKSISGDNPGASDNTTSEPDPNINDLPPTQEEETQEKSNPGGDDFTLR